MSSEAFNENLVLVCPDQEAELVDKFAVAVAILTLIGSLVTYFIQRHNERQDANEARIKENEDMDRNQALERVRTQISVLIGPMHRAFKTQMTTLAHYYIESGHGIAHYSEMLRKRGQALWYKTFFDDYLQQFIEDPHSDDAVLFRHFVTRRLKPIYTRVRELHLKHMADLADMPTQEEWLQRWTEEDVRSPYNGSININVIFDTYTAWTFEYDDIVESWAQEDFRRMQPSIRSSLFLCNDLIDLLYDNAKAKEAKYNNHVSIHKNTKQENNDMDRKDLEKQAWVKSFFDLDKPTEKAKTTDSK